MGKQRFRLSHMIPNAWFYRLRDMNTHAHNNNLSSSNNHPSNSFCYTPKLYSSPSTINRPPAVRKQVLGSIYIRSAESTHTDQDLFLSPSSSCYESPSLRTKTIQDSSECELTQEIDQLQKPPQIITKSKRDTSTKENDSSVSIKIVKETDNPRRKKLVSRVNIGSNAPKAQVCKRVVHDQNKFSSSCCIVKSTFEPCKDLKESMMEIIVDYNIRASKDLEKLLAFYLSLNSNEYHDMIVKVFEEIWLTFDFLV